MLLYFGGNAEEISWTLADARWPRAWTIAGLNYRGYGRSEGKPGEQALVADGLALFDAMAARPMSIRVGSSSSAAVSEPAWRPASPPSGRWQAPC